MVLLSVYSALFLSFAPVASNREEHSLLLQAAVGDRFVYQMKSVSKVGGGEGVFTSRYEMTVTSLEPKGIATFNTASKSQKLVQGGKELALPDSSVTAKLNLNGAVVSVEPAPASADEVRMRRIMQYQVPTGKAKVGTRWTWTDPAARSNGEVVAQGKGEVIEFSKMNGIPCAKLRITIKETTGTNPASGALTVWVSLADGMMVVSKAVFENVPLFPGALAKMQVDILRVGDQ